MKILDDSGFPMMSEKEVEIIDKLIEERKPETCLEWGSGNSTVYFTQKHTCIKEWVAVEHNRTYLELLGDKLKGTSGKIVIVENDWRYVRYPKTLKKKFDFILIDGEQRDACVDMAFKLAKKDGVVLLHDCDRIESKDIMEKHKDRIVKLCDGEQVISNGYCAHRGLALFKI